MAKTTFRIDAWLPALDWARSYSKSQASGDAMAAVIVTIMLIPQSLAYALLAGLPPEAGLYASIVPIVLYSLLGTSRALAVGPVAVVSLMTASTIGQIAEQGTAGYATAALTLAFLSGVILLAMGVFRLGLLANFLSHPVISGFITASGILIAVSQMKHILGVSASGHQLPEILGSLFIGLGQVNLASLVIGALALAFLFWVRLGMKSQLTGIGVAPRAADIVVKAGPVLAVILGTYATWQFGLVEQGVKIVGAVPQSLPPFTRPDYAPELIQQLLLPALVISIIGFVESISVAQTLAAKKRERIRPNQELIALGAANIGASFSGGFPVTGGFARSVVNDDAGAETPAAGMMTAVGLLGAALFLTPLIYFLPVGILAATIIVAVTSLIDFSIVRRTWRYARSDFFAVMVTIVLTLVLGVEVGVGAGLILSIALHLYRTSQPHVAIVGRVPDTEHFRNIHRHEVDTSENLLTLRIDESLYFANARFLEDLIYDHVTDHCCYKHVVLLCSAVNDIDYSALETLEAINHRLIDMGIGFHLAEVKGPVMDKLQQVSLLSHLNGQVYLTQYEAWTKLKG